MAWSYQSASSSSMSYNSSTDTTANFTFSFSGELSSGRDMKVFVSTVASEVLNATFDTTSLAHGFVFTASSTSASKTIYAYGLSSGTKYYYQGMMNASTTTVFVYPYSGGYGTFTTTGSSQITYTLTFDPNGGISGALTQRVGISSDGSYTFELISSLTPSRSGYKFLGWSWSSTATYASFYEGSSVTLTASNPTRTLFAVWEVDYTKLTATAWDYTITNITSSSFQVIVSGITSGTNRNFRGYYTTASSASAPDGWSSDYYYVTASSSSSTVTFTFSGLNSDTTYYFHIQGKTTNGTNIYCLPTKSTWDDVTTSSVYGIDDATITQSAATYNSITVKLTNITPQTYARTAYCTLNGVTRSATISAGSTSCTFTSFTGLLSNTGYTATAWIIAPDGSTTTFSDSKNLYTSAYPTDTATISVSSPSSTSISVNITGITSRTYYRTLYITCGAQNYSLGISSGTTSASYDFTGLSAGSTYSIGLTIYAPDDTETYHGSKNAYTRFGFAWSKTIAKGEPITNLKAEDWDEYTSLLTIKANRRGATAPKYTDATSGEPLTDIMFNQVVAGLYNIYKAYYLKNVTKGDKVLASYFSTMVAYLNTDDN